MTRIRLADEDLRAIEAAQNKSDIEDAKKALRDIENMVLYPGKTRSVSLIFKYSNVLVFLDPPGVIESAA